LHQGFEAPPSGPMLCLPLVSSTVPLSVAWFSDVAVRVKEVACGVAVTSLAGNFVISGWLATSLND